VTRQWPAAAAWLPDELRLADLTDASSRLELLAPHRPSYRYLQSRWMIETVNRLWSENIERITGAAMLMCDVDHFRQLNDGLGYAEADRVSG
jgi:GGDEF domain-containing protein